MSEKPIICGDAIGAANDGWITPTPSAQDFLKIAASLGPEPRLTMMFWKTESPFWWLATHVLHTVCNRLGMVHAAMGVRYKIDHYLARPDDVQNPEYLIARW